MPQRHLLLFCIVCFALIAILILPFQSRTVTFSQGEVNFPNQNFTIKIDIAISKAQLETGLMYRDRLDNNQGMLLIFKKQKNTQIWMKNMLIPLDMVFISAQNQVVSILKNIPPCLKKACTIYQPNMPSKMVLELNTGKIDQYQIKIGDKVSLVVY